MDEYYNIDLTFESREFIAIIWPACRHTPQRRRHTAQWYGTILCDHKRGPSPANKQRQHGRRSDVYAPRRDTLHHTRCYGWRRTHCRQWTTTTWVTVLDANTSGRRLMLRRTHSDKWYFKYRTGILVIYKIVDHVCFFARITIVRLRLNHRIRLVKSVG